MKFTHLWGLIFFFFFKSVVSQERNIIDDAIINALDNFKQHMSEGFPMLAIPPLDPLQLGHIDLNINEDQLNLQGWLDNIAVNGLSTFVIDYLHVNIFTLRTFFNVSLSQIAATGQYNLDGLLIHLFPLYGGGSFNTNLTNLYVSGSVQIALDEHSFVYIKDLEAEISLGGFIINFENLLGDPSLSDTVNSIMSSVLYDLLIKYRDPIQTQGVSFLMNFLNEHVLVNKTIEDILAILGLGKYQLHNLILLEERLDINSIADDLFAKIRRFVTENGIDPLRLPEDSDDFQVTLYNTTMDGWMEVSNVRVGGLSAVHRTGDCRLTTNGRLANVALNFGTNDVLLGADLSLGAGILQTNLQLQLIVRHVSIMVDVAVEVLTMKTSLNDFHLNEIGPVEIQIKGIPMASKKISNLLTLVSNTVKDSLVYAFQELLRPLVESIVTSPETFHYLNQVIDSNELILK